MDEERKRRQSVALTRIAAVLLLVSLALPTAVETARPMAPVYGYEILLLGMLGALIFQFGWFGNVALLGILIFEWNWLRYATGLAFANSLFWTFVADDVGAHPIRHLVGYYVWMAAMVLATLPLFLSLWRRIAASRSDRATDTDL